MNIHLAGIIPIITKPMDFQLDWHDCLMPVAPNYYAIEHAVLECAYAGCDTIWIVANDDTTPLVRHRIGDYVQDPVWLRRKSRFPSRDRRPIPIFYVPMDTEHHNKRNCISWTILFGAETALKVGKAISKWVNPERFYVSFPYSVYPVKILRPKRKLISTDINFAMTFRDKSFATDDMLGFTFNKEHLEKVMDLFHETENSFLLGENLSNEEKYFEENLTLDKTFGQVILYIEEEMTTPWYHPIDSWNAYCEYLGSDHKSEMRHPGKLVISYHEFNPVGEDDE